MKTNSTIFRHHEKPLSRQAPRKGNNVKKDFESIYDHCINISNKAMFQLNKIWEYLIRIMEEIDKRGIFCKLIGLEIT